ncbi:hypothetical protein [Sphingomonas panaciterrae]|uniref:hypothetical protein n=1 Tax=Sphingomonas panaciterrae TaxID=1462999 RepID=UPI002FF4146C
MTNDPPDERSLAVYEARARFHASTLALVEEALAGLGSAEHEQLAARVLTLREQARCGLRVMKALAAAWCRDLTERQERRDQWEIEIQQRYKHLAERRQQRR